MTDLRTSNETRPSEPSGWAVGWTLFAGFMMIMIGCFQIIAGLAGLVNDDFFVQGREYLFRFDTTTWGWIHLSLGIVVLLAGIFLFTGSVLARTVGVIMALVSAILAFSWTPWYPVWGLAIVFVAMSVIWALTAHGRDIVAR